MSTEETALEVVPHELLLQRDPDKEIESATIAAKALKNVIDSRDDKVVIRGKTFLRYEDWQTVGQFYGYSVETDDAMPCEVEGIKGAKAKAILLDRGGNRVGGAEAYCMRDEEKWAKSPWFQLASMAQTRAGAKALRNRLAWVAVLAGYSGTPAEEMTGHEDSNGDPPMLCPECGGGMWDNRKTKKGRQPDFKCKDKTCNKAIWLPKDEDVRKTKIRAVSDAFKVLNQMGDEPQWTKRSANEFVAERFEGLDGVDALDDSQLDSLMEILSGRIDSLKSEQKPAKQTKLQAERESRLKQIQTDFNAGDIDSAVQRLFPGKELSELSLDGLNEVYGELIPF